VRILNAATVSAGPINEIKDLEEDEHALARNMFISMETRQGVVRTVASPFRMSATPPNYRFPPPGVGEHTEEILEEMGYSHNEREALRAAGVL